MPSPLDGLRKASSISASSLPTNRAYGDDPGSMKAEMPLGPWAGGIFAGDGGHIAPAIEGLKDVYRSVVHGDDLSRYANINKVINSPLAKTATSSMAREGPAEYLTALAQHMKSAGEEGTTMAHHIIDGLFTVMFGK